MPDERKLPREIKAERKRLQGRVRLPKKELGKIADEQAELLRVLEQISVVRRAFRDAFGFDP